MILSPYTATNLQMRHDSANSKSD